MAKGKKSKGTTYVSKGERRSVARSISKAVRRDQTYLERALNALDAHSKGRRAYITVPNDSKKEPFKRVLVKDLLKANKKEKTNDRQEASVSSGNL